jgi:hypothetical protein
MNLKASDSMANFSSFHLFAHFPLVVTLLARVGYLKERFFPNDIHVNKMFRRLEVEA